jgi:hypothetical protein
VPPVQVAILVPILDRPHRIEPLLQNIAETTPEPHRVLFAVHDAPSCEELDRLGCPYLWDYGDTWPNRINRLFHVTTQPYVFLGADDVLFHPGWLLALMREMEKIDGVVVPNDLHNPRGTLALVSRRYIEEESGCIDTPNVVVYPGYGHCFVDDELFGVAKSRGRYAYCPDAIVEHYHPDAGKAEMDATYEKGLSTLVEDAALHEARRHLWT